MNRLLRILVLVGGALMLLQGTRTGQVSAQAMPDSPAWCCDEGEYDFFSYPCSDTDHMCCQNRLVAIQNGADCSGSGITNLYTYSGGTCGQVDPTIGGMCAAPGATCPGYSYTDWASDPADCTPLCISSGGPCATTTDCCTGLSCAMGECVSAGTGDGGGGDCGDECSCDDDHVGCGCVDVGDACSEDSDCSKGFCNGDCYCEDDDIEDPIMIDLSGSGYSLTNIEGGVKFDIVANRKQQQLAWGAAGWNGGFLALDRNGNGRIDSGIELFTGISPQASLQPHGVPAAAGRGSQPNGAAAPLLTGSTRPVPASDSNGFTALALYDRPDNGGNGDGQITASDSVYAKLRVWVDANHNGISEPGELMTLSQLGISSISLKYQANQWSDKFGNRFSNKTSITRNGAVQWIYDVYLKAADGSVSYPR